MAAVSGSHGVLDRARQVLEEAWVDERHYCRPNKAVYPHQWLWDSCFHAIAWACLGDDRGSLELASLFEGQLDDGFVPHMRYNGDPGARRGPLPSSSSFTQPPIYAHAARVLQSRGFPVDRMVGKVAAGLDYLWRHRRSEDGLIFVVHPWETGTDDSPRWDSWLDEDYDFVIGWVFDAAAVDDAWYSSYGSAGWSRRFAAAPAGFNALTAHAFRECAELTGDSAWADRAAELAGAVDEAMWNPQEGLWDDVALVGGGESVHVPTLDGVLPTLVTADQERAERALAQLSDEARFAAPYGLAFTARDHPASNPEEYWRGTAWPQMNYLAWLAARRWGAEELSETIVGQSVAAAVESGFAEYWNPLTAEGLGAAPQTWASIVAAYLASPGG